MALEKGAPTGSILHPPSHCDVALDADRFHGQGRAGTVKNLVERLLDTALIALRERIICRGQLG